MGKKITVTEKFVRMHARRITQNGYTALSTNGDPLLVEAFDELGWTDPYIDPDDIEAEAKQRVQADKAFDANVQKEADAHAAFEAAKSKAFEAATLEANERAVLDRPDGHVG